MQVHSLDTAHLITDVQFGNKLSSAVVQGRRADFAFMLAMLSGDMTESTPLSEMPEVDNSDTALRRRFELSEPQRLTGEERDFSIAALQVKQFHDGGIQSAKLQQGLNPVAMHTAPLDTCGFPEEVYHNFDGHLRRKLRAEQPESTGRNPDLLYASLIHASRNDQLSLRC